MTQVQIEPRQRAQERRRAFTLANPTGLYDPAPNAIPTSRASRQKRACW